MSTKILGVLCILLAFWAGSQKSFIWGFFGFLPFFCVGIALLTRSKWIPKDKEKDPE